MNVAVVGAGVMGCATAWALRARGVDVTVVEQFELDHVRGSSHGRTRIFRLAYPDARWAVLAREALSGWRELERETGVRVLEPTGYVELCARVEQTSRDTLASLGIGHRLLDAVELQALGVAAPQGWTALWQDDAGVVLAEEARRAFLEAGRPLLETGRRVETLDELDADVVVVTAGAWVGKLVPDVPVRVTRETLAYFRYDGAPVPAIVELDEFTRKHAMYALHDPVHGVKAGAHHCGYDADPDVDEPPDEQLLERIAAWVRTRLPGLDPRPVETQTCLYTSTADESFVLERRGRVVVGSACSGHGFKFAPAVGRRLAGLALGR